MSSPPLGSVTSLTTPRPSPSDLTLRPDPLDRGGAGRPQCGDPRVGQVIEGRYRLLSKVATGGMGVVYRAERLGLGRTVAVKFLLNCYVREPEHLRAFGCEAMAMGRLSHPHCVPVTDYGLAEDPYLVMEFVEGSTLRRLLEKGPLCWTRAVRIQLQLLAGLAHAHRQQVVHRDVKPANIMLHHATAMDEQVRVLDFGLAGLRGAASPVEPSAHGSITGTPPYMAPEQWEGAPADARTDIYAAGVVLYEMLAGQRPFCGPDVIALMAAHVGQPPPSLAGLDLPPGVAPALEAIVLKALCKSPQGRYQTAEQFHAALKALLDSATDGPVSQAASSPVPRRHDTSERRQRKPSSKPSSRMSVIALAMLLGLCTLLGAAALAVHGPGGSDEAAVGTQRVAMDPRARQPGAMSHGGPNTQATPSAHEHIRRIGQSTRLFTVAGLWAIERWITSGGRHEPTRLPSFRPNRDAPPR